MRRKNGVPTALELAILEAITVLCADGTREAFGFLIAKQIGNRQGTRRLTSHGTLYKALAKMTAQEWLAAHWEDPARAAADNRPRRHLYMATAAGAQLLEAAHRVR